VLAVVVVQDAKQWNSYNVKPLTFVHSSRSPLYTGMEEAVAANLGYIISTQKSDGGVGAYVVVGEAQSRGLETGRKRVARCRDPGNPANIGSFSPHRAVRGNEHYGVSQAHKNR
jgi:hypothetical protein